MRRRAMMGAAAAGVAGVLTGGPAGALAGGPAGGSSGGPAQAAGAGGPGAGGPGAGGPGACGPSVERAGAGGTGAGGTSAGGTSAERAGAGGAGAEPAAIRPPDLRLNLISLSHVNDPATTSVYPGDPAFELETIATIENDGFYLQFVREGEHTGTHWGAPGHFNAGAALADDLEPADLFLPAVKIDVRRQCARDADFALSVRDLRNWERRHGRIPEESMVILRTGWESRWGTAAFYNFDADGVMHQPGFSLEAVRWLVDTGRLGHRGGTGTDTFSPDLGSDSTYAVSLLVYQRHRISLEILANLGALPTTGGYVLCGGTINKAGSGSTALIYGVLPPG